MEVFSPSRKGVNVWGPTASINVEVDALGGIVDDSWILVDVKAGAKEIVDVKQCFNDVSFVYALGNDQSRCLISLTFLIFYSWCGDDETGNIDAGFREYVGSRISKKPSAGTIAIGEFARNGWLVGIDVGPLDIEHNACYGTVHFLMEL